VIDFAGGIAGVLGLMAGIFGAQKTGVGCDVDVSLRDTAVSMLNYLAIWCLNLGLEPQRYADSTHSILVPGQTFRTRDGYLAIFCAKEKFWEQLCQLIARPDLLCDPRFSNFDQRLKHKEILIPILEHVFAAKTNAEWLPLLTGKVPCAPVRSISETLNDPILLTNDMIVEVDHPIFGKVREVGCPIKVSGSTPEYRPGPALGEDTDDILSKYLGLTPEEIVGLRNRRVI
jgi:crotonobetainyl-CoA:carnitine CoA-transferase CaiB-like acyl-CoA transferase